MDVYATLGTNDAALSETFYDAVLSTIGWSSHAQYPGWRAYSQGGTGQGFVLWICKPFNEKPATVGNGTMVGFPASSPAQVDAFHAAALAHGGSDEGTPGPRPKYGQACYGAYLRDPSGNKIAIVFNE